MSRKRKPPVVDERFQLKHFVRLVDDMVKSRFIQMARRYGFLNDSTSIPFRIADYDIEEFRSFFASFRQVALLPQDAVYLENVIGVVEKRCAGEETRKELGNLRAFVVPRITGKYRNMRYGHDEKGVHLYAYEILEALAYGDVFHTKEQHQKPAEFTRGSVPGQWLWGVLFEIIDPALRVCLRLVGIIRDENLLDDADIPPGLKV